MGTLSSIILIIVAILFAGFFSGAETALVSCSRVKLRSKAKRGSWRARFLESLLHRPESFFSIVLVGTNLSVIVCTATATALAIRLLGDGGALVSTLLMTPLLLIAGEVIPKATYLYHADRISILVAPLLRFMSYVLWPAVAPATLLARLLTGFTAGEADRFNILSTREELLYLYKRGREEGTVEKREGDMINRIFEFGVVKVGDLAVPMDRVVSFPVTASVDAVIEESNRHSYSRFPLVSPDGRQVVGVISMFDLLGLDGGERLANVMHQPLFVHEDEFAERLLLRMKDEPLHFAVVTSRSGEPLGIITLENILENIVGDIGNEESRPANDL